MRRLRRGTAALAVAGLLALPGCTGSPEPSEPSSTASAASDAPTAEAVEPDLALAESTPVEDSVYPAVGHPDVDALLYDLDLAWAPDQRTLTGTATLTFRAARDTPTFRLDLGPAARGRERDARRRPRRRTPTAARTSSSARRSARATGTSSS